MRRLEKHLGLQMPPIFQVSLNFPVPISKGLSEIKNRNHEPLLKLADVKLSIQTFLRSNGKTYSKQPKFLADFFKN